MFASRDGLIEALPGRFRFVDGVILVLARPGVVQAVVLHAHEGEVVFCAIARIVVQVRDLAVLLGQIALEPKTQRAATPALVENPRRNFSGDRSARLSWHRSRSVSPQ